MGETSMGGQVSPAGVDRRVHNCPVIGDAVSMLATRGAGRRGVFGAGVAVDARHSHLHVLAHRCSGVLLGLAAVSAVGVVAMVLMGGSRPVWWARGETETTAAKRRELASGLDNGAWTVATSLRPMTGVASGDGMVSEPWSVSVSAQSASAWLNEKLPRWLSAQKHPVMLPHGAELRVVFESGVARMGMRMPGVGVSRERYLALSITPRVDKDGLWLPASSASMGRLEVPVGAVIPAGGEGATGIPSRLASALRGEMAALPGGAFRLPDGRTVRLLRLEVVEDRLVLTMRTEAGRNGQSAE